MTIVTALHDLNACFQDIHFRRPRKCYGGDLTYIPILNKKDKNAYIVQSRSMYMPFFYVCDAIKHAVSFELAENHPERPTITCLESISKHCIAKTRTRFKQGDDKDSCTTMFTSSGHLRFYDVPLETIGVFNIRKERIPFASLQRHEDLQVLFVVSHVWANNVAIGVKLRPLQIRQLTDAYEVKKSLFVDDPSPIQECDKYLKMHRAGIPTPAIEHKMRMDGVPSADICKTIASFKPSAALCPSAAATRPPLPNALGGVLAAIKLGGIQLKTMKPDETSPPPDHALHKLQQKQGWKPPSLEDLLKAKERLKSLEAPSS
jgi:hypothetical protein